MKKNICIIGTGGTIAGAGAPGRADGYTSAVLGIDEVAARTPRLFDIADIRTEQISSVAGENITYNIWAKLAERIDALAAGEADGFVIAHGTDTLEETAYMLSLTVNTRKPVVVTGSMRPATSLSPDGPMNLLQAAAVAADDNARGRGVLVSFADALFTARDVQKESTYRTDAFGSRDFGCVGYVREDGVHFYFRSERLHTADAPFTAADIRHAAKVEIVYFAADADPAAVASAADRAEGIVVAGTGDGTVSDAFMREMKKARKRGKAVVRASRVSNCMVKRTEADRTLGFAAADTLTPQKARILLSLALTKTQDADALQEYFGAY